MISPSTDDRALLVQHGLYRQSLIPICPPRVVALHQAIDQLDHLHRQAMFACPPDAFSIPVRLTQADLRALAHILAAATDRLDERIRTLHLTAKAANDDRASHRARPTGGTSRDFCYPRRRDFAYACPAGSSQAAGRDADPLEE